MEAYIPHIRAQVMKDGNETKRNDTECTRHLPETGSNGRSLEVQKPTDWLAILAILGIEPAFLGGNTIVIHYSNELTFGTTVGDHHPLQVFSIYYGYIVPELHFSCCAWVSLVGLLYDQRQIKQFPSL